MKDVVGERLTHDCPCSRQTGKRFRSSYTSEKNGPQTQPTNKQAIEFDLQLASQSGHQNEPRPITSTYIKTLVLPANDLYEDPALVTCSESVPILHPPVGQQKRLRLPTFSQQRKPAAARIANKQVCKQLEIANIFRLGPGSYPVHLFYCFAMVCFCIYWLLVCCNVFKLSFSHMFVCCMIVLVYF